MLNQSAVNALTEAGEAFGHTCTEWQEEMQKFAVARMRADMEVPTLLAECETPLDLIKAQRIWFATATQEYLDESTRLARISATAMQRGLTSWHSLFQPPGSKDPQAKAD
ncbi:hypothetical protein PY365_23795 [Roseiarcaceae bacterium H3SJ34-1]|uniref:hypothetical protein n=1 Tax=Terripilifer ovatus TaxID=3032367 RepID=UPI003AB9B451|nr:hypothetical protein [Roseiarcaceae bacterium H3SJ34-1]